jgi:hypothetical protein
MEKKLRKYNVEQLGEMPLEWEDGTMQILVCRMGDAPVQKPGSLR